MTEMIYNDRWKNGITTKSNGVEEEERPTGLTVE